MGKLAAWKQVTAQAKVVVLESAKSTGFEGLTMGAPPLQENGLCQEYETQIDCNSDPESVRLSLGPDFIVRKLQMYSLDKNKCQAFTQGHGKDKDTDSAAKDNSNSALLWSLGICLCLGLCVC